MRIIGHRGAKGLAPENTIASLLKALEHKVDEIECDVHITKDGVPILIHDQFMNDHTGEYLIVRHHTLQELRTHKSDLPTLAESIQAVNRQVPMMIELKPGHAAEPVVHVVQDFLAKGWQPTDFLFVSFDFRILQQLHQQLPAIEIVVDEMWSGVRASYRARKLGARRVNMYSRWLWSGFVRAMSRNYDLYAFPVNDVKKARRWTKAGLSGIITDFPDLFEK